MKVEVAVLPGLPGPNSPYGLCGRKATFEEEGQAALRLSELCLSFLPGHSCQMEIVFSEFAFG